MKSFSRTVAIGAVVLSIGATTVAATGIAGASSSSRAAFNGTAGIAAVNSGPACQFLNDNNSPITSIAVDRASGSDQVYFEAYFGNGITATKVTFKLSGPSASPLGSQTQVFNLAGGSTTNLETPFGIPPWTPGLTAGTWHLKVTALNGTTRVQTETCSVTAS